MNSISTFLIKVLTGPNQGAELQLDPGTYTIGSSDDSDVNFTDALVAPRHVKLELGPARCTVTPLALPVFIDGKPMRQETIDVRPFQFITLGTTYFTFGPANETWPPSVLAPLPPLQDTSKQMAPGAQAAGPLDDSATPVKLEGAPRKYVELTPEQRGKRVAFLAFLLFLVMGTSSVALMQLKRKDPPTAPTAQQIASSIEKSLRKFPYARDVTAKVRGRRIEVSGFVRDGTEIRSLYNDLKPWWRLIIFNVTSDQRVLSDVQEILSAFQSELNVSLGSEGGVVIKGYSGDASSWNRLKSLLETDLPGYPRLKFEVTTGEQVVAEIEPILNSSDLAGEVQLTPMVSSIVASGTIVPTQVENWQHARQQIVDRLAQFTRLQDNVVVGAASPKDAAYQYTLETIGNGPLPWITLQNGDRFFTGAVLPNGWTLSAIATDYVELSRGTERSKVPIGGNVMDDPM